MPRGITGCPPFLAFWYTARGLKKNDAVEVECILARLDQAEAS